MRRLTGLTVLCCRRVACDGSRRECIVPHSKCGLILGICNQFKNEGHVARTVDANALAGARQPTSGSGDVCGMRMCGTSSICAGGNVSR
jgi:hypothetical protein